MVTLMRDDVGTVLKARRESLGYKLEDAARSIRVRCQYLEAIETSYYDDVPALVYLLGYIRKYSEYLGLNAQDVVDQFKSERSAYHHLHEAAPVVPIQEDYRPQIALVGVSVIAIALICLLWQIINHRAYYFDRYLPVPREILARASSSIAQIKEDVNKALQQKAAASETALTAEVTDLSDEEDEDVNDQGEGNIKAASAPVSRVLPATTAVSRLVLLAKGKTWVKILDKHNQLVAQTVLQDGDTYFAPADKHMRVLAENPALIEVYAEEGGEQIPGMVSVR
jgi:cytoskeleton protein RodZ